MHPALSQANKAIKVTLPSSSDASSATLTSAKAATSRKDLTSHKRTRNLNLAKEKLYEMKKTIDAKVNSSISLDTSINANKTLVLTSSPNSTKQSHAAIASNQSSRTTPRKVKKRSGERSFTAGLVFENQTDLVPKTIKSSESKENLEFKQQFQGSSVNLEF